MTPIEKIWSARNSGQTRVAADLFDHLKAQYHIPGKLTPELLLKRMEEIHLPNSDVIDMLCIEASLARRFQSLSVSDLILRLTGERFSETQNHFSWLYQRGMNALHKCLHLQAMRFFFDARDVSRNQQEYFGAFIDGIICLEALGLDFQAKLDTLRQELAEYWEKDWARSIAGQVRALEVRQSYRQGQHRSLEQLATSSKLDDQSNYHLLWMGSLPYMRLDLPSQLEDRLVMNSTERPLGYMADYRLGTIHNIECVENVGDLKASEMVERFYLWTWRWLVGPSTLRARQVITCKLQLEHCISGQLTAEDNQLLANALYWLGLFIGTTDSLSFDLLRDVHVPEKSPIAVLEFEAWLIAYVKARCKKDFATAEQLTKKLRNHSLYRDTYCRLWELLDSWESDHSDLKADNMTLLARSMQGLWPIEDPEAITVNLTAGVVTFSQHGASQKIRSVQLARLLHLIEERDFVNAADIASHCFEIAQFDQAQHITKVSGLLTRANQILYGLIGFARREAIVHVTERSAPVKVWGASPQHLSLLAVQDRFALVNKGRCVAFEEAIRSSLILKPRKFDEAIKASSWLARTEVEHLFGLTRSTVLRRLKEWEQQGKCIRKGVGKATRYKFEEDFLNSRSVL